MARVVPVGAASITEDLLRVATTPTPRPLERGTRSTANYVEGREEIYLYNATSKATTTISTLAMFVVLYSYTVIEKSAFPSGLSNVFLLKFKTCFYSSGFFFSERKGANQQLSGRFRTSFFES